MPELELKSSSMNLVKKVKKWFAGLSVTQQGYVLLIILLIVGIILRWEYIIDNIIKGFDYFSK
jgi:hypothetical protein